MEEGRSLRSDPVMVLCLVAMLAASVTFGQQDPMYNQYLFNAYTVNAAEAGARSFGTVSVLQRWQWLGVEGAPATTSIGLETGIGKGWGLALNAVDDRIGPATNKTVNLSGAYHINLNSNYRLSLGLSAVTNMQQVRLDRVQDLTDLDDPLFVGDINSFNPNLGGGVLVYSKRNFFGASMPRFIEYKLTNQQMVSIDQLRHLFVYGGHIFDLSNMITLKPSALLKVVSGGPVELDLNAVVSFYDIVGLGLNFRTGDGIGFLVGTTVREKVQVNYAYEVPLTPLRKATIQTHEIGVRYIFGATYNDKIRSPRFFN